LNLRKYYRQAGLVPIAAFIAACGGGGGSSDTKVLSGTTELQLSTEVLAPTTVSAISSSSIEGQPVCAQKGGQFPPGMTLSGTCTLQGTPTEVGTYLSQVTVTAPGYSGSLQVNAAFVVGGPRLRASVAPLSVAAPGGIFIESVVEVEALQPFAFREGDVLTYSLSSGSLPSSVSLDSTQGKLSGINVPSTFVPAVFAIGASLQRGGLSYSLPPFSVSWPRSRP